VHLKYFAVCDKYLLFFSKWQKIASRYCYIIPILSRGIQNSVIFFQFYIRKGPRRLPESFKPMLLENQSLNGSEITEPGKRLSEHSTQPCISPDQRRSAAERR